MQDDTNQLAIDIQQMVKGLTTFINAAEDHGNVSEAIRFFTDPPELQGGTLTEAEKERALKHVTPEQARMLLMANMLMIESLTKVLDTAENIRTMPSVVDDLKSVRDNFKRVASEIRTS